MKNLLGTLSVILFISSMLSITSAAMSDQENLNRIVIQKFKPAVKKWRSYVCVHSRCAGKISPLQEKTLRKNFSKIKTHFLDTVLINDKTQIHDTIDQLGLDNSDVNFSNFRLALESHQQYISAINYYGKPLGLYAIVRLSRDEQLIIEVLSELFECGVSVNHDYGDGKRLLDAAIADNLVQVVKYLLQKGANPNAILDSNEPAPLHAAYREYNIEIISMLLAADADTGVWDEDGYTILHRACLKNQYQLADLLLLFKADPDANDIFFKKPIDYASTYKNPAGKNGILTQLLLNTRKKKIG